MVEEMTYGDRLSFAMRMAEVDSHQLAAHLKVTYQAIQKVLKGKSSEFTAANNARAAAFLGVDPTWLALGVRGTQPEPFSSELMQVLRKQSFDQRRRIENALRAQFDMDPLPRAENEKAA